VLFALVHVPQQRQDFEVCIREDNVAACVEFEVQSVQSIRELQFEYAVGANLGDRGYSACFQVLAQFRDKRRGRSGGCARIFGEMAAEARVDEQLLAVVGFVELDEEDSLCDCQLSGVGAVVQCIPMIGRRHS
jgi:hypothetical protein